MDREFLKKHNLMESHNRFMKLCNEGYLSEIMTEDDPNQQQGGGAPDPSMGGGDPNAMGGAPDPSMGGGDPNAMGGAPDPSMGGGDPNAMGGAPDPSMGGGDPNAMGGPTPDDMGGDEPQNDNVTVDVTKIVDANEKLNDKENSIGKDVNALTSQSSKNFEELNIMINKILGAVQKNNEDIMALKSEIIARNPTEMERNKALGQQSFPFNIGIDDYVRNGTGSGVETSKEEPKEYVIRRKDLDGINDGEIERSF